MVSRVREALGMPKRLRWSTSHCNCSCEPFVGEMDAKECTQPQLNFVRVVTLRRFETVSVAER
jgi:hypothetical protein